MPICSANWFAPSPASRTCSVCSITRRASFTGFLIFLTEATAPAFRLLPSMMDASISCSPSCVKTAPRPALNSGKSSSDATAVSTASSDEPPLVNIDHPAFNAVSRPLRYSRSRSGVICDLRIVPAPPCIASAILFIKRFYRRDAETQRRLRIFNRR